MINNKTNECYPLLRDCFERMIYSANPKYVFTRNEFIEERTVKLFEGTSIPFLLTAD